MSLVIEELRRRWGFPILRTVRRILEGGALLHGRFEILEMLRKRGVAGTIVYLLERLLRK